MCSFHFSRGSSVDTNFGFQSEKIISNIFYFRYSDSAINTWIVLIKMKKNEGPALSNFEKEYGNFVQEKVATRSQNRIFFLKNSCTRLIFSGSVYFYASNNQRVRQKR